MQADLVDRARNGDREAFAVLAAGAVDRLYGIARLILRDADLAEDATQDALVRAWTDLPTLRDVERFDAWLYRLVVRACADIGRHRRRWRSRDNPPPSEPAEPDRAIDARRSRPARTWPSTTHGGTADDPRPALLPPPPPPRVRRCHRHPRGDREVPASLRHRGDPHGARRRGAPVRPSRQGGPLGITSHDDLSRRLTDHYAAEAPPRAPDWLLEQALEIIDTTRQRRVVIRVPWRLPTTNDFTKVAVAAVVVVAVGAIGLAVFRPASSQVGGPRVSPSPSPSVSPSPSPSTPLAADRDVHLGHPRLVGVAPGPVGWFNGPPRPGQAASSSRRPRSRTSSAPGEGRRSRRGQRVRNLP